MRFHSTSTHQSVPLCKFRVGVVCKKRSQPLLKSYLLISYIATTPAPPPRRRGEVTPLYPRCCSAVSKVLPRCIQGVTPLYPRCYSAVFQVLLRCIQGDSPLYPRCYSAVDISLASRLSPLTPLAPSKKETFGKQTATNREGMDSEKL